MIYDYCKYIWAKMKTKIKWKSEHAWTNKTDYKVNDQIELENQ